MYGKDSGDENDGPVPDTISYHIPPMTPLHVPPRTPLHDPPRTPLHDRELRTHRSIYWNGQTGM